MKKTGIFAAVIIVACTAVYVVSNILVNNKEAESQKDIQSADDKSVVYASLDEIRSQAADELDDIKNGKYPNMKCGDIHLDITDADTIRNINISQMNQLGKDNLEIIENQKKLVKQMFEGGVSATVQLEDWKKSLEIKELDRTLLALTVDKIYIYENKQIKIHIRYQDMIEKMKVIRRFYAEHRTECRKEVG